VKTLIDFDGARVVSVPVASGFGEDDARECMLLEGPQGWGEFSPPRNADDAETLRWLTAAVEPGTVGWPDPVRGRVRAAVRVPAVAPADARLLVAESGCHTADVAVGAGSLDDDVARVDAVRAALGTDGAIRCDAGGAWSAARAAEAVRHLDDAAGGLQYVVEPCSDAAESADLRVDVPVAVVVRADGAALTATADVLILVPGLLGGVRRALRVAEAAGLPCVAASGRETSVGMAAAAALAGALPELPYACPIGRPPWMLGDVVGDGRTLVPHDGHLPVAPMPPGPDPARLAEYAVTDPERLSWWRQRLTTAREGL
jgi:o-succinylbenzoate synthase